MKMLESMKQEREIQYTGRQMNIQNEQIYSGRSSQSPVREDRYRPHKGMDYNENQLSSSQNRFTSHS